MELHDAHVQLFLLPDSFYPIPIDPHEAHILAYARTFHDAHVKLYNWRRGDEGTNGWYDYTMRAEHWFALPVVQPLDAAMLLCEFNPDESAIDWMVTTNLETKPQDHTELLRQIQAEHSLDPKPRTLRQWWELARGWKHHSWIDRYIEFTDRQAAPIDGTQPQVIWTPERKAALQEHRDAHGITATALKFRISVSRVKQLTVAKTHQQKAATLMNAWNR